MFETFFFQPVLNLLIFLYNVIPGSDFGITIVLFAGIIKYLLHPLQKKAIKSQKALQEIQPEVEEIKRKHKDNREELGRATLQLYKDRQINPFSSCLPLLIQLPFLFAIFRLFQNGFEEKTLDLVYPIITRPESINAVSFGFIDLSQSGNLILSVLAGGALYFQTKMMLSRKPAPKEGVKPSDTENLMNIMNKQMLYVMPVFVAYISYTFPAGLALYWFVFTALTIVQQYYLFQEDDRKKIEVETKTETKRLS